MKESVKFLHQAKDPENPLKHRAIVCIICDRCIIGTEAIHKLRGNPQANEGIDFIA
jgi:hypothetical protein